MILEAIVRREGNNIFAKTKDKKFVVKQLKDREYSNICHRLRQGEKIFIDQTSKKECCLIIHFDTRMEDFYFQRMFGMHPSRRRDITPYQQRIIAAKNKTTGYQY